MHGYLTWIIYFVWFVSLFFLVCGPNVINIIVYADGIGVKWHLLVAANLSALSNLIKIMLAIVFLRMLVTMSLPFYNVMSYLAHEQAA